jgi:hypothetical protein
MFMARRFPEGWQKGDQMPELIELPVIIKIGGDMRQD